SCFSISCALMAPGTRVPSEKITVGVPVILYFLLNARLRSSAAVSQLDLAGFWSRNIQSSQTLFLSLAHQTFLDFSTESALRMGIRKVWIVTSFTFCRSRSKRLQ